jgi:polyisoprenoid-binding protein YceI
MKKLFALFIGMSFSCILMAQDNWTIDKEVSNIGFGVSHFLVNQTIGYFKDYDASLVAKTDDFNGATVSFTARTASVFTDNEERDHHLKSDDFFDAAKYPEMKFMGTLIKKSGKNYILKGNLTIRDVTKPVSFPVTYNGRIKDTTFHAEKAGFVVNGSINRLEYGLKWNETFQGGGPIVGDKVELYLHVEFNRQKM